GVSPPAARLGCGATIRGAARTGARRPRQRRPQADRRAGLHVPRLRHQLLRSSAGDLAGLQPARRYGKSYRRVETRSGSRRFLHEIVLRHGGRLPRRASAVQPAGRVPTGRRSAGLSRASHPPGPGPHLRSGPGPSRPSRADPSVAKLGRSEDEKSLVGQHITVANSNVAEVGTGAPNLTRVAVQTAAHNPNGRSSVNPLTSEFRLNMSRAIRFGPFGGT